MNSREGLESLRRGVFACLASFIILAPGAGYGAQSDEDFLPPIPDQTDMQGWLDTAKPFGWVVFREIEGRQIVDFVRLQSMRCRLSEIRYSVNSTKLDRNFPLAECDRYDPTGIPDKAEYNYIVLKPGEAKFVTVQAFWADGSGSEILVHKPCDNPGQHVCALTRVIAKPPELFQPPVDGRER